jgi:hypothetical protein
MSYAMSSKGTWHKVYHPIKPLGTSWWLVLTECGLKIMVMPPHSELPKGPVHYCTRCSKVEANKCP